MPDLDAILAEIKALAGTPIMQPTDCTAAMIGEVLGLGRTAVYDRMAALVEAGLYETTFVLDPETHRIVRIWRRLGGEAPAEGVMGGGAE